MSRLEELIEKLCPDGVEYRNLEDCCNILDKKRKPVTKASREAGEYPYYGANGIQDYVSEYIFDGVFILVGEDGSVVTPTGKPVVNWAEGKIWVNNHAHIVEETEGVLLRYLYHYIQTVDVRDLIHGNIPKLNQGDFRQIKVPVPPIEVQAEIVKILDNFTELTAELTEKLTAELTARKKQYEYYRDELLTFGDEVEYAKIEDVATVNRGIRVVKEQLTKEGLYPVYQNSLTSMGFYFDKNRPANTTFVIGAGAAGEIGYCNIDFWAADDCYTFDCSEKLNSRYLYHTLQNQKSYIMSRVRKASIPRLARAVLEKMAIPVPPLEEQQRIVDILDRFDRLCNDISEGLPAEIEARQKQYEYYRDKLLTFKEKA